MMKLVVSRGLKFRAWDFKNNSYVQNEQASFLFGLLERGEQIVLEQFTGRSDDCGVGIYEGDIVRIDMGFEEEGLYSEVVYNGVGFALKPTGGIKTLLSLDIASDLLLVTGNIHENRELLD
jgi:uncharacterized phage protein (TIGR01671 family)